MKNQSNLYPDGAALVVGGSGGTGQAISRELARSGVNVVLTYNKNKQRAESLAADINGEGGHAEIAQLTMGEIGSIESTCEALFAKHGRLHSVFFATGFDIPQVSIGDLSPDLWQRVLRADAEGVFNVVHCTLPYLRKGGGGSYTHVSSAALQRYAAMDILSVAPKAAIEELIKGIAKEEGVHGIRANSIAIGVIETGIFLRLRDEGVFDQKWTDAVLSNLPLKRFGQPEEVAHMAVFLGSNKAAYTTGQLIPVDGGLGV
ncbi:MAG: SDR family oxidoreductase [Pseudomonadales bacterium]|nr:MAG: SDR family oxidoreductase [Pseudomonadales bacterium]